MPCFLPSTGTAGSYSTLSGKARLHYSLQQCQKDFFIVSFSQSTTMIPSALWHCGSQDTGKYNGGHQEDTVAKQGVSPPEVSEGRNRIPARCCISTQGGELTSGLCKLSLFVNELFSWNFQWNSDMLILAHSLTFHRVQATNMDKRNPV